MATEPLPPQTTEQSHPPAPRESPTQEEQQQQREEETTPAPAPVTVPIPGPRATRLKAIYAQALKHTLDKLSWENFASCYPTISSSSSSRGGGGDAVLRQVQAQMVSKLGDKCDKEFENIMAARNVVVKLNELEGLMAEASFRKKGGEKVDVAPHLLPPDKILAAHMTPALKAHRSQLNARLQTTQSQNALLAEEVKAQREEIEELLGRLEAVVGDVGGANEVLGEVVGELAAEIRDV